MYYLISVLILIFFFFNEEFNNFILIFRLLLKDVLPLTEDHFVIGNTPANLRLGLDIGGNDINPWRDANPTMALTTPEILTDTANNPSHFIYDFIEPPLN